jgi:DNA-directed RNA polymerase specialized sigma24 family protein
MPQTTPPSDGLAARLNEFHQANLRGEPTAPANIFSLAFKPLRRAIRQAALTADDDHVTDACTDAIVAYLRRPSAFDPGKSSLWTFLFTIAIRRLADRRRAARRLEPSAQRTTDFELLASPTNNKIGEDHLLAHQIDGKYVTEIAHDAKELKVLELMCCEVRETEQYAEALGLDVGDPATAREVKRVKDKLKARLRKIGDALDSPVQ